ncbi:aminoacyl-tRNA hydrolase [Blattabacterium cuenoti]|uniref:aminoacyl-tRNA hydrolase n=1 Tax=Blattabacterium cuenoti TaxID=1653831 RepID=UPI00163C7863|nr:aminoacyl-tRNA hydrolase [Blattabacterium cuenoti]
MINKSEKFLIIGLGNPGNIYQNTRHNIGFMILDQFSKSHSFSFSKDKLGLVSKLNYENKIIFFLKPSTYINYSGKSVKYWMIKKRILLKKILVISDDIYLDFGMFRLREKGGDGGHNGLKNIEKEIGTSNYARLRFGIKKSFKKKIEDYVLSHWKNEELKFLIPKLDLGTRIILSFVKDGLQNTMNKFNNKIK